MRLIDADALREHAVEADRMGAMLVVGLGYVLDAPTVAPDEVKGRWMMGKEFPSYPRVPFLCDGFYCSVCEQEAYWDTDYGQQLFVYCPNCGARMKEETK